MSDSRLYSRLLLPKGHGYPLFHPQPFDDLPEEARRVGTEIGDVGVVTSNGSFDVIFNICRAADDPINRFGVPEGFEQVRLIQGDVATQTLCHRPGSDVSNTKISKRRLDVDAGVDGNVFLPVGAGAVLEISTSSKEAAVLLLPDGASRSDLRRLKKFRNYALKHAQRWYAFVNGELERMVESNALYLVTGVDKSSTWSVAAVENQSEDCRVSLKLKAAQVGTAGTTCAWEWESASSFADSGPRRLPGEELWKDNQTVFLRGFKVAVRPAPLKMLNKALSIVDSKPSDILSKSRFIPYSRLSSGSTNSSSLSRSPIQPSDLANSDDSEYVEYFPTSLTSHPANAINTYLFDSYQYHETMVAVTHDDEWASLLNEDDDKMPEDAELIRRVWNKYSPSFAKGGVWLEDCRDLESQLPLLHNLFDQMFSASSCGTSHELNAAAKAGYDSVVQQLLEDGADVNQGGEHGTALQAASAAGHETVVQLLLDHGANVNLQGGEYGNALQAASRCGSGEVVALLLGNGADVNSQGGAHGTALQAASQCGSTEVVRLLLKHGADVNSQGGAYGTALKAASALGHETVVQVLLEKGADISQGGAYGTALRAASAAGHETVVWLLLEHGADVNMRERLHGTALYAASASGHETVVQILIENGADVNSQGSGTYGTALQAASVSGHETVVQILLERGADVNSQSGGTYGTALQAASVSGHETVVQILLERGADVNSQGGRTYGTALNAASALGHETVVRLLLQHGADVNQGGVYGSALEAASVSGHETVVQILLERGADVNSQGGGTYGTALNAASALGHETVVRLLLQHGADVNQRGVYGSALHAASASGHEMVVRLLLQHGADVNLQGGVYGTALQAASGSGHETIVRLLLQHSQRGIFGTALQAASARRHETKVRLLRQHDADTNSQGGVYETALQGAITGRDEEAVRPIKHGADLRIKKLQAREFGTDLRHW
ncbi:ankyrin repeat-containing domain protein [Mycena rebaudengoi]|nr:ankyrin repeat-containing domain protein [Mycena rebaudengoi]